MLNLDSKSKDLASDNAPLPRLNDPQQLVEAEAARLKELADELDQERFSDELVRTRLLRIVHALTNLTREQARLIRELESRIGW